MSKPINILYLQAQEAFGADAAVHAMLARELDRSRFRVHVACAAGDPRHGCEALARFREIRDINVVPARFAPSRGDGGGRGKDALPMAWGTLEGAAALRRYVSEHEIRVVHSCERPRDVLYNMALARTSAARSVIHVHIKWAPEYGRLPRWAVRHADAVMSISRFVSRTVTAQGRTGPIFTVHNGIEPGAFLGAKDDGTVRAEFSIASDAVLLLSVSRLFEWKGQRELMKAFARVRARVPKAHLLIVGADAPHLGTKSFRAELEQLAAALEITPYVSFAGGRSDVPRLMAACDLFTMPSFEEPFGLVYLEAMAAGKPVISLSDGGTPEVVEHEVTGLLSPPWDVPQLADNIVALATDPVRRRSMGEQGRARVLEYFNAKRMAQQAAAAYEELLQN